VCQRGSVYAGCALLCHTSSNLYRLGYYVYFTVLGVVGFDDLVVASGRWIVLSISGGLHHLVLSKSDVDGVK
jgi:hypothetical protein